VSDTDIALLKKTSTPSPPVSVLAISLKQNLCLDLLVNGSVHSFVDFFYLTHETEEGFSRLHSLAPKSKSKGEEGESQDGKPPVPPKPLPDKTLLELKENLAAAEAALRKGQHFFVSFYFRYFRFLSDVVG
jgi:hypothetical protein